MAVAKGRYSGARL